MGNAATTLAPIVLTMDPPGTPGWLAAHKGKIGSNDLAVLMGIPRFGRTKLRLWGELTGKCEREDISEKPEVRRGVLLEPVVAQLFANETRLNVLPSPGLVQHPELSFIAVTPDGMVNTKPIEMKTVGQYARKDWNQDIPLGTQVQGQGHAWCLRADGIYFAAFCLDARQANLSDELEEEDESEDGSEYTKGDPLLLWAERERRDDLLQTLGTEAVQFWENHVLKDIPPEPGADIKAVKAIWSREKPGEIAKLTADLEIAILRNAELASIRTAAKHEQDALKATIGVAMGTAEYGVTPGMLWVQNRVEARRAKVCDKCGNEVQAASYPRVLRKVNGPKSRPFGS